MKTVHGPCFSSFDFSRSHSEHWKEVEKAQVKRGKTCFSFFEPTSNYHRTEIIFEGRQRYVSLIVLLCQNKPLEFQNFQASYFYPQELQGNIFSRMSNNIRNSLSIGDNCKLSMILHKISRLFQQQVIHPIFRGQ